MYNILVGGICLGIIMGLVICGAFLCKKNKK